MEDSCSKAKSFYRTYHTLIYLSIVSFVAELAYAVVNQSALPPYLVNIGLETHIGVIIGMFLVVEAILKSPMGTLGDRIGRRPLIVAGALLSCLTAFLVTLTAALAPHLRLSVLLVLRAVDGVAAAAIWPTMMAAVSGSVPADKRTFAMNAMTVTYMVGIALGPLVGGYANDTTHSTLTSFYVVSVLFMITALVALFLTPHKSKEEEEAHLDGEDHGFKLSELLSGLKAAPYMIVLAFIAFFGVGLLIPVIKLFAMNEFHMSEYDYGKLVLPIAAAVAGASLLSGFLGDRWGKARSVRLGVTLTALSMWWITMSRHAWELKVAGAILGIGFVIAMPSWLALVSEMSAAKYRGSVIGALGTSQGIGAVLGTVLGSFLYFYGTKPGQATSIGIGSYHVDPHYLPFYASATALSICVVLVMIFVRERNGICTGGSNAKS